MKEEKFKIINFIRDLIVYMDTHLENFPRKDMEIKAKLKEESYNLLELAYKANVTTPEKRTILIEDIIAVSVKYL